MVNETQLIPQLTLPGRMFGRLRAFVSRLLGVGLPAFGVGAGGMPACPLYPVDRSMQALGDNPWVYACIQAIATDLSGLPLVVEEGTGDDREQIADHPILELFRKPHLKTGGVRLRKQWYTDHKLSGDAYIRVWRNSSGVPIQLGRIPPQLIEPLVGRDGEEVGWKMADGSKLAWSDVLHISDLSWPATESLLYGQSPIQPLALGLQVDKDSRKHAGRAARRGRLEMMLSPKDALQYLNPDQARGMSAGYNDAMTRGDGVYVANQGMDATALSLTPRDGEFLGMRDRTRAEILAVFGVPETRVGAPAANYGTAKQQMRVYWETLMGIAALFDDELSRLAPPGIRIVHSFAKVEALQTSQTERQSRAAIWVSVFGMTPRDAARYEGFIDAPIPEDQDAPEDAPEATDEESDAEEPHEDKAAIALVQTSLTLAAEMFRNSEWNPEQTEQFLRMSLKLALIQSGAGKERADNVACEAASVCALVSSYPILQDVALIELDAFNRVHARRIVALAMEA